jgi:hypothetical protein
MSSHKAAFSPLLNESVSLGANAEAITTGSDLIELLVDFAFRLNESLGYILEKI